MARSLAVVVLAAGEGTRMHSHRPKSLHRLCGRPMLLYVLDALGELPVEKVVVVVGRGGARVAKAIDEEAGLAGRVELVEQPSPLGTGDAVAVGLTGLPEAEEADGLDLEGGDVLVLPGDAPLLRRETLRRLVARHWSGDAAATALTARLDDPTGYGRIVRARDGGVARVVEEADASDEIRAIDEVWTSIACFRRSVLAPALRRLSPDNAQGEYYLTDVVAVLHDAGYRVDTVLAEDPTEVRGVNDRAQLAVAEAELRARINGAWMRDGVTMVDPARTYVDGTVRLSPDVTLLPGTMLGGATVVGRGAEIGPETRLVDCVVGEGAVVERTEARFAQIGAEARVGPYAVLEPGAQVAPGAVTGPFFRGASEEAG